jgi:hypothetical protein
VTSWLRIDAAMPSHPKILGLSDRAYRAWMTGLCYCRLQSTDGFLPAIAVKQQVAPRRGGAIAGELVDAGLWEPNGDGYMVHDWLDYQPQADAIRRSEQARHAALVRWQQQKKGDG